MAAPFLPPMTPPLLPSARATVSPADDGAQSAPTADDRRIFPCRSLGLKLQLVGLYRDFLVSDMDIPQLDAHGGLAPDIS